MLETITFREFCASQGYKPNDKDKNLGMLANEMGVSISYVSKLYNSKMMGFSEKGKKWNKVCDYVAKFDYKLINDNELSNYSTVAVKKNKRLEKQVEMLTEQVKTLQTQLENYSQLLRLAQRICETDFASSKQKQKIIRARNQRGTE